ncbi:hypothetical protein [Winogradskyella sp. 3972H.M.0a.05]|uniref:hypothetical protein n=1 Tax=Winogradskyella sp. 3972H.M.0a.05 TaxID=2950277 RepID=UPI00339A7CE8
MKKITALFLLLLTVNLTNAQLQVGNVSLDFGETITNTDGSIVQIAGVVDNTIYVLANKKKKYFLQSFDNTTKKFKKSIPLKFDKINGNKVFLEDLTVVEDKVYLMASYYDKKNKKNNFVAKEVSKDLKLGKFKTILSVKVPKKKYKGGFVFDRSYDDINYIVSHVGVIEKKETLTYSFVLLDKNMSVVLEDNYESVFEDRKDLTFDFSSFAVNEHGDVFITTTESYRDKKQKTTHNNITLHSYLANKGYEKQELKVNLSGKRAINCSILETKDNSLHMIGFYSDLKRSGKARFGLEGIFDVTADYQANKVIKETFNEFTVETRSKIIGERRAKKGKDLNPYYRNTHFFEKDNGGILILSDYFLSIVGRPSGIGPLQFTPITYISNEVIVTSLNPDGTLQWSNVVPKEQQVTVQQLSLGLGGWGSSGNVTVSASVMFPLAILGRGPEYLSSLPLYKDGKLTIIVNDDPKNIGTTDIDDVKKVRNVNKMIPVAFIFDENTGEMERIDPKDFEKRQIVVQPVTNFRVSGDEAIIYGSNKKGARLGTLKLK